ncbi:MAG: hypothetical protein CL557_11860 [Alphaproteobacteria bacterium]|nr:hypothetical protein [Alphaproteobacteria bacterium]
MLVEVKLMVVMDYWLMIEMIHLDLLKLEILLLIHLHVFKELMLVGIKLPELEGLQLYSNL